MTVLTRARASLAQIWVAYLAVGTILTVAYLFAPHLKGNGPLINLLGLSSSLAIVAGVLMHKPRAWVAWLLLACGQLLFFAGDVYTYSYPKLFHHDVPFPSPGDWLYLAVYPALMAGLFMLVRRRNPHGDLPGLIDSAILTVGIALLSWVFLIAPNLHLSGLSLYPKLVSSAYPLGDVLLLAGAIRLAVDTGKRAPAFYLLTGSIVCLLTVDSAYDYALLKGTYNHQLIYDVGWIAYYVLWGAAALHPSMRTLEEPALDTRNRLTQARLGLLATACLVAPGIRFVEELHNPDIEVVVVAAAALFLLVVARMAWLVRREERAVNREVALRGAGVRLVAAAGERQVQEAAVASAQVLLGDQEPVRLVLRSDDATMVTASSEGHGWLISAETLDWLFASRETTQVAVGGLPPAVRHDLRLDNTGSAVFLPLAARDETRGVLVVGVPAQIARESLDSLEALATQVSLAVEGALLAEDLHRRESEARFRSLVAHSSDLITVLAADGTVTYQSPSIERLLGYSAEDIEGTRFDRLLRESDRPRLARILTGVPDATRETHAIECSLRHRDGTWLQFEVQQTNLLQEEHVRGIVLNSRDVSEQKAFEDQLAHQAFHDPVTGLANRALFADRVQHALTRMQRGGLSVAVVFIDLDDFKTVNDSLGHAAGDFVLQEVAARLGTTVRPTDTVARFGGDEFAVLLDGIVDTQEAADVTERILRGLDQSLHVDGKEVFPRASVGICIADRDHDAPAAEELLRNADVAMYMAKRDSKGGYRLFEPRMHERVVERLELRAELQRAIDSQQLEVYYQPVVRLDRKVIYGIEALLRWRHPTRGSILPDQFIPLAEETGLIIPIGRWVLGEACRQAARLNSTMPPGNGPLTISVNLSVKQLQSDSIVPDVRAALESTGLDPSALVLEITESVMMADMDLAIQQLNDLKALGIRLAMDDFGTGYSSLSYLSRLPVDILKMDRSFLVSDHEADSSLAAAIISLGRSLKLDVVAEGVERLDQVPSLRDLGCELGQGFLFAEPMNEDSLTDFLTGKETDAPPAVAEEQPESHAA
ncbi:MAG: EAL domain-containing protein [Actinobacteria bacterium]|nr:MAG: EAL domain-containing protein [Actinomycetota bacterium]